MHPFFKGLPEEPALDIERLSRLLHELRENRAAVLAPWPGADEAALLARIAGGEIPPHPAYEHYLAARILGDTREDVRLAIYERLQGPAAATPPTSLHLELRERLESEYGARIAGGVEMHQDALLLSLPNGVALEIRYAAPDAYALRWRRGEAELGIDTAPGHAGEHGASHFHAADGAILPDPLTAVDRAPWENLRALLEAVLADPLLERRRA